MKPYTVIGEVQAVKRIANDVNGNPRFNVLIYAVAETLALYTAAGMSQSYEVTNKDGLRKGAWKRFYVNGRGTIDKYETVQPYTEHTNEEFAYLSDVRGW